MESHMIKHHPTFELLQAHVHGDLPASLSVGISIHAEMCLQCKQRLDALTEEIAERVFEENKAIEHSPQVTSTLNYYQQKQADAKPTQATDENDSGELNFNIEQMIADITSTEQLDTVVERENIVIDIKGSAYSLPTPLHNISRGKQASVGKLTRSRLQLDEGEIHSSLLHISPGGGVPAHTHKGFELTVLLNGSFSDEHGEYNQGDFIMLDKTDQHYPVSEKGCLCFTVANDALHFTQGINKLLNPVGSFIY